MLRKHRLVASLALLGLLAAPALANQGSTPDPASFPSGSTKLSATESVFLTAANTKSAAAAQPETAKSALEGQGEAAASPKPVPIEYPALAMLAAAVISMAALSRRDALTFDNNKR